MSEIRFTVRNQLAEIELNNPAKLNALTPEMLAEIARVCDIIEQDPSIAGVILSASGDRFFCAGADINAWADLSPDQFSRQWVRQGHRVFDRLARLSKPTIAALAGNAFGGGLELVATCDIRVAAPDVEFALPESSVGIIPGWSGTQRLGRLLPESVLKEMVLFGRKISSKRALKLGFVAEISPKPIDTARTIADNLRSTSPRATEIAKYMIHAAADEDTAAMIDALGSGMAAATSDKAEGVAAFRAKRKPDFFGT